MRETNILQQIRVEASKTGIVLSRNNSGAFKDKSGRFIKFGLFNPGGSDLIGFKNVVITKEMIGKKIAIFLAIEVKQKGKQPTVEQRQFIDFVNKNGGIAFVCDDVKNLQKLLDEVK
jgi:hypothetical protein